MKTTLKLRQAQVWKQGDSYYRIVRLERLEVEYKFYTLATKDGIHHTVSKKEFCRLLKGATLVPPAKIPAAFLPEKGYSG